MYSGFICSVRLPLLKWWMVCFRATGMIVLQSHLVNFLCQHRAPRWWRHLDLNLSLQRSLDLMKTKLIRRHYFFPVSFPPVSSLAKTHSGFPACLPLFRSFSLIPVAWQSQCSLFEGCIPTKSVRWKSSGLRGGASHVNNVTGHTMLRVVVRFAEDVECGDQPPYMCAAKVGSMMCGFPSQLEHRDPHWKWRGNGAFSSQYWIWLWMQRNALLTRAGSC